MRDIPKEIADDYQEFFNFLNQEHNLILTISEMDEIVFEAQKLVKKLTIPAVIKSVCPDCNGTGTFQKDQHSEILCVRCSATGQTVLQRIADTRCERWNEKGKIACMCCYI